MKRNAVVFFGGYFLWSFSSKIGEIWANSHPQKFACSYTYVILQQTSITASSSLTDKWKVNILYIQAIINNVSTSQEAF